MVLSFPDGHDAAVRLVPKARGKYQCHPSELLIHELLQLKNFQKSGFCIFFFCNFEDVGRFGTDSKGRKIGSIELVLVISYL
ncbi:unnamed protein product [Citrullus colocynthis]|uniref:Uncharacterized protein n=1 Tax=Citrullus colocynthis TaxID=252529 RepID=A0ABP0XZ62_9ROSI